MTDGRSALLVLLLLAWVGSACALTSKEQTKLLAKKPHIVGIEITGNQSFGDDEIKSQLTIKEDGFWQSVRLAGKNRLTKGKFLSDEAILGYFYRSRGFIDAKTNLNFTGDLEKLTTVILINFDEGIRYRIDTVTFGGELGHLGWEVHLATRKLKPGDYINYFMLDVVKQEVKGVYANHGFPYAEITPELTRQDIDSTVAIHFDIRRGDLVVFGDVAVDTARFRNPQVRSDVILKEIAFKKGDVYSRKKYLETQQRLIRTNLFNYVTLKPQPRPTQIDSLMPGFVVTGVPSSPKFINFSGGAAQDPDKDLVWDLALALGNRNVKGTARKIRLASSTSFAPAGDQKLIRARFDFTYVEPYFLAIRLPLITSLIYEPRLQSIVQDYEIERKALEATAVREFSLETKLSVSALLEQYNIYFDNPDTVVVDTQAVYDEAGVSQDRKLVIQLERDTRPLESRFNPPYGSYTTYRLEYAGGLLGGDNYFLKFIFNWAKYNGFIGKSIFASRLRFGFADELSGTGRIPSRDRFYLGGAFTIRGFPENSIYPSSAEDEGGEAIGLLNLELRTPLVWQFWGSTFFDSGFNAWSIGRISFNQFKYSVGVGLQFMSPVGPIRLDYGERLHVNNTEPGGRFHFSILYAF
ncbi:MAG: BamA/TamA family outer membrane protein [bacterium]